MSEVQLLNTKALMVFCEGPHDVAFCRLVFRKLFRAEKFEHIFAEFPAPLNNLFRASLERHLLQDMSVDMAHKFFLPDSVLKLVADNCEWLILLFNCGGKDRIDNPKGFLEDYLELFAQARTFPEDAARVIADSRYLLLYDVDDQQPQQVIEKFSRDFASIGDQLWISGTIPMIDGFSNAAISDDKGVYIWSSPKDTETRVATLEDILLPLFHNAQDVLTERAQAFVNEAFIWNSSISAEAKRKKAIITTLGQKKKPGSSMNVILEQSDFIKTAHLNGSAHVQTFVNFLTTFLNLETAV